MKSNISNTKELCICFLNLTPSYAPVTIHDEDVNVVSEAKLLGVVISDDLKWNRHIDYIKVRKLRNVCIVCASLRECFTCWRLDLSLLYACRIYC